LLTVLAPDVVLRGDRVAALAGGAAELRGAAAVARQAQRGGARAARAALINGAVGVVVAPRGRLLMALVFTIVGDKVTAIDIVAEPDRVQELDLAVLDR
jgi:RNA polymerase sigma-70 factor (ECF subfamily)